MERDFLGLNLKESVAIVKEEVSDVCKEQVFAGGPSMHWAFSNKVSALPQFMSFKATHEERSKKVLFDPLASSAFQPVMPTTASVFDTNHKPSGLSQRSFSLDRQGSYFTMQAYPFHAVDASHRSHEIRALPVSSQAYSVSMTNPFFKMHGSTTMTNNPLKQQPHSGIPMASPHPIVPVIGSMPGTYASRNASKSMSAPGQLTIFYAGAVHVYDDITPEKAQAIMSLANGSSAAANVVTSAAQAPTSAIKHMTEAIQGNQSHAVSPCSGLSSPLSVSSHSGALSNAASSTADDLMAVNTIGTLTPRIHPETPKVVTCMGSAPGTLMPAAVPQARKASLARFLEKRKERVTSATPYSCKKSVVNACGSDIAGLDGKSPTASVTLSGSVERL